MWLAQKGCLPLILVILALIGVQLPGTHATLTPPPACPTAKITFTQADGCHNDDSFEFCLPANDPAALAAVQAIAPNVECIGSRGRARCNIPDEVLCLVNTKGMCVERHGAMNDTGWQTVCELASLPLISKVVPTFYE
ncbi:MAG TPA: hypothetical protein VHP83_23050 [Aggregatilineaceae bacterium]|nr:hypothetical protein [Aggregatilineaceae bacterium]